MSNQEFDGAIKLRFIAIYLRPEDAFSAWAKYYLERHSGAIPRLAYHKARKLMKQEKRLTMREYYRDIR